LGPAVEFEVRAEVIEFDDIVIYFVSFLLQVVELAHGMLFGSGVDKRV
jgi:hypothetical protein